MHPSRLIGQDRRLAALKLCVLRHATLYGAAPDERRLCATQDSPRHATQQVDGVAVHASCNVSGRVRSSAEGRGIAALRRQVAVTPMHCLLSSVWGATSCHRPASDRIRSLASSQASPQRVLCDTGVSGRNVTRNPADGAVCARPTLGNVASRNDESHHVNPSSIASERFVTVVLSAARCGELRRGVAGGGEALLALAGLRRSCACAARRSMIN